MQMSISVILMYFMLSTVKYFVENNTGTNRMKDERMYTVIELRKLCNYREPQKPPSLKKHV